jgi:3-oxoacyl-[acyl-carrier protein] reductase
MTHLTGKVALVTGGSRGIGAAIARRLARDGADVAFTYASAEDKAQAVAEDIRNSRRRALALVADNRDPAAVTGAIERTATEFGRLDILVNNAGIFIAKPFEEYSLDDFELSNAVNVRAVFVASQAAARHMQQGGRIITIGSNLAERVPKPSVTLYAMNKSALVGLTKGMARDLGARGITANLVQPGPTDTDMNPAAGPKAAGSLAFMALPHYGEGRDIAGLVAFLAGEEGRFVTGAVLTIDGGYNA